MVEGVFGTAPGGELIRYYRLENVHGLQATFMDVGATLISLHVPDAAGAMADIVLGCDTLEAYAASNAYFGAVTGRYANRIAQGTFTLDGKTHTLAVNMPPHHLHGGETGFDKVIWKGESFTSREGAGVEFQYTSPHLEEGYPGTLSCTVRYLLGNDNALHIIYTGETDLPTVVNLTHHSYWNLKGHDQGDVLGHVLRVNADRYTPTDETLIPTGALELVAGTPLDFREAKPIGQDIGALANGYDHNFVLNGRYGVLGHAATVTEPESGRVMHVHTTEPGLQFFTANFFDNLPGKGGAAYNKHAAFCLEAQHFPDSPNKPDFPSVVLRPGELYQQETVYSFEVMNNRGK